MAGRSIQFTCQGHPNIRASHHKTLEITRDQEISARATCIVGVAADFDPLEVARLRGPVRLVLRHGGQREEISGTVSPFVGVRDSVVFRLSDQVFGNTFASKASRAARDLDREFVAALQSPKATIKVEITECDEDDDEVGALTLLALPHPRLAALIPGAAERLRAVDAIAAPRPGDLAEWVAELQSPMETLSLGEHDLHRLTKRLEAGERIAVVVPDVESPVLWSLVQAAVEAGMRVSSLQGIAPSLCTLLVAAFGATGWTVERLVQQRPQRFRRRLQNLGRSDLPVVFSDVQLSVEAVRVAVLETLGNRRLCLAWGWGSVDEFYWRGSVEELGKAGSITPRGSDSLVVAIDRDSTTDSEIPTAMLRALLDEGTSVRTLSRALEAQTGWPRRRAYEAVLDLSKARDSEDDD